MKFGKSFIHYNSNTLWKQTTLVRVPVIVVMKTEMRIF